MTRRTGSGIALLADETRRTMVALMALHPRHPTELSRELGLSLPAVSRQLGLLTAAGLVQVSRSRVDLRRRMYSLDYREQGRILAWLAGTGLGLERSLLSRWLEAGVSAEDTPIAHRFPPQVATQPDASARPEASRTPPSGGDSARAATHESG